MQRRDELPQQFKIADNVAEDIQNNKFNDIISLEEYSLDEIENIACYKTSNGFHQTLSVEAINQLPKSNEGMFTCPMTRDKINIENVFTVKPSILKNKLSPETQPEISHQENKVAAVEPVKENTATDTLADKEKPKQIETQLAAEKKFRAEQQAREQAQKEEAQRREKQQVTQQKLVKRPSPQTNTYVNSEKPKLNSPAPRPTPARNSQKYL